MKKILLVLCGAIPYISHATGMAVSIDNIYFKNVNKNNELITINNEQVFNIPAQSMCKIDKKIMFLPPKESSIDGSSSNYVISVDGNSFNNNIVIDKYGISLASNSFIKAPSHGSVKNFSLVGYCGSKYKQFKYLNVQADENESSVPTFKLMNCNGDSNYLYVLSNSYIKVNKKDKIVDFQSIQPCALPLEESK